MLKLQLLSTLQGYVTLHADTVRNDRLCRLGKWYYTDGQKIFGSHPSFKELELWHKKIHKIGADLVESYQMGNHAKAISLYEEIDQTVAPKIMDIFEELKGIGESPQ